MFSSFWAFIGFVFTVIKWILILAWAILWTLITSKMFWLVVGVLVLLSSVGLLKGLTRGSLGILGFLLGLLSAIRSFIEYVFILIGLSALFYKNK